MVATFYVDALKKEKKVPSILRTDCGTENGVMAAIQCYLHQNAEAHKFSTSVSNQRIENWWSLMRRSYTGWIMNFFKGLVHEGSLLPGNYLHMECVWFVFSRFLQDQLDSILKQWNSHHIRRSQNHTISGVPDEMYYLPENFGYEHRGLVIDDEHINNILQRKNIYEETNNVTEAHEDLQDYFWHVVNCEKLPFPPTTWEEATMIFKRIIEKASI